MKVVGKSEYDVTIEMSHEEALSIVAVMREACFGDVLHDFVTRVGRTPKQAGEVAKRLNDTLNEIGIFD